MERQVITDKVQAFVSTEFLVDFGNEINLETDLFDEEIIDSFGFVELVSFIEGEFGVKLNDDDMGSPDIGRVAGIVRLIELRQTKAG